MAYEIKKNSGSLFKNNDKKQDTSPDYTGTVDVDGTQYWISGWIKKSNDGTKSFLSLSFKAKDQQPSVKDVEPDVGEEEFPF